MKAQLFLALLLGAGIVPATHAAVTLYEVPAISSLRHRPEKVSTEALLTTSVKVGDQEFYNQVLKPLIDQSTELGQSLGSPDEWTAASLEKIKPIEKDWLEFSYKVADLRKNYLLQKRFSQK